jgi:hypothetical protein
MKCSLKVPHSVLEKHLKECLLDGGGRIMEGEQIWVTVGIVTWL